MLASLSTLFRRAHAEAHSGSRTRMTYRERFRSALRRAWRDARTGRVGTSDYVAATKPNDAYRVTAEALAFVAAVFAHAATGSRGRSAQTTMRGRPLHSVPTDLPPRPG